MIRSKTQAEKDTESIERATESVSLAISAAVQALNNAYDILWDLPDDRLLAVLNGLGVQETWTLFGKHQTSGVYLNQILDLAGTVSPRAKTDAARQLTLSPEGQIVVIYPEPDEEPV